MNHPGSPTCLTGAEAMDLDGRPVAEETRPVHDTGATARTSAVPLGRMDSPFTLAGNEDLADAYSPEVTVSGWPIRSSSDEC
eukprot:2874300-Alexandrium_andersonii.AAC.1